VRVTEPQSGAKVRDAQVEVALTKGSETIKAAATHENAGNSIDYAAHIQIQDAGAWDGVVRVTGPAGASEVTFLQQVSAPRTVGTIILVGIPFAAILGVFGAMWFVRTSRRGSEHAAGEAQIGSK
jgi:hypothetical protein